MAYDKEVETGHDRGAERLEELAGKRVTVRENAYAVVTLDGAEIRLRVESARGGRTTLRLTEPPGARIGVEAGRGIQRQGESP